MRISLNWLNDYIDIQQESPKEMAERITRAGIHVEGVLSSRIDALVVGLVEECVDHPDSDHLHICQVHLGNGTTQIVCGASNVKKGQKVVVALPGAILPGGFEIKKTTIRGVESNGMICALYELGLEEKEANYHKGIHVIEAPLEVGSNPLTYLGLDDVIYELDLNPNRAYDCTNHIGFAYEVGSVLNKKVKKPDVASNAIGGDFTKTFTVNVLTDKCTLYKTRMVKDVVLGESPSFIKKRLKAVGMRPINNVVDISNYVMLEYGQPLHFFDADKLGNDLVVRMAQEEETVITLDEKTRKLAKEDLVIVSDDKVVAIAGVMGCANSEVDTNTKNIVIESAIFDPYSVRYTSLRLGLRSEASLRFEKGLNFEYTDEALERACFLLEKYASGKVIEGKLEVGNMDKTPKIATVSREKINAVLGMQLKNEDINQIFERLSFGYTYENNNYIVTIPNRRLDVSIREDLIEEIGRLYGYDNIKGKIPNGPMKQGGYNEKTYFQKQLSKRMRSLGLNEVRTYTLLSEEENKQFNLNPELAIPLQLPMSADKSVIRQTMIPSMLKIVDYNVARGIKNISIYEISNIYKKEGEAFSEDTKLAVAMVGSYVSNKWNNKEIENDFYTLKGIVENLLDFLGYQNRYSIRRDEQLPKEMHPYQSAIIYVDNHEIGYMGKVHPSISKLGVYVLELSINKLFNQKTSKLKYKSHSIYPMVNKDLAFMVSKDVDAGVIVDIIRKIGGNTLISTQVFDIYQGNNIADDKKSIAISLTFSDVTKTLTDEEVNDKLHKMIVEVETKIGGILRDK